MTRPQPDLFRDRGAVVDVEAARTTPTIACSACGRLGAPRVLVGAGLDLHECGHCGAYSERRHCCGLVAEAPRPTSAYRAGAACPRCGVDRIGEPEARPALTGGTYNAEGHRLLGEIHAAEAEVAKSRNRPLVRTEKGEAP